MNTQANRAWLDREYIDAEICARIMNRAPAHDAELRDLIEAVWGLPASESESRPLESNDWAWSHACLLMLQRGLRIGAQGPVTEATLEELQFKIDRLEMLTAEAKAEELKKTA